MTEPLTDTAARAAELLKEHRASIDRLDAIQSEVQEAMTEPRDLISQNELRARTTLVITARRAERHEQEEGTGHAPQS